MNVEIQINKVIWSNRKTFCLRIEDNGELIVISPKKSSLDEITRIVQRKRKMVNSS